jgi:hypothetical protein
MTAGTIFSQHWWETETNWWSFNVPDRNLGGWLYEQPTLHHRPMDPTRHGRQDLTARIMNLRRRRDPDLDELIEEITVDCYDERRATQRLRDSLRQRRHPPRPRNRHRPGHRSALHHHRPRPPPTHRNLPPCRRPLLDRPTSTSTSTPTPPPHDYRRPPSTDAPPGET